MATSWVSTLDEDEEGNLLLTFTDEQMQEMGWLIGDEIDFIDINETGVTIVNLSKNKRDAGVS